MANTKKARSKLPKSKKKKFSSLTKKEAFEQLGLTDLIPWKLESSPIKASPFFQERIQRLKQIFSLEGYEEAKKLLIDAICEEAMLGTEHLRIWKGAQLESDIACGNVDYLIAERRRYLDIPLLCIIEAKRDDFEKGLAQCLVEMQACQWQNQQANRSMSLASPATGHPGSSTNSRPLERHTNHHPIQLEQWSNY
jgi:hypothetical protein